MPLTLSEADGTAKAAIGTFTIYHVKGHHDENLLCKLAEGTLNVPSANLHK